MSDIGYDRCPNDDMKAGGAPVGYNPTTGQPIEVNVNGVAVVLAVHSALVTVTAAMKAGHEQDFLEKVALALFERVSGDPHCLCPMLTLMSMVLMMTQGIAGVTFDKEGHVVIAPPDLEIESGATCMHEEYDDGSDEGRLDQDEPEDGGTGYGEDEQERA